jgi:O-acetyl-ADP-ribose deacetylase (regulator of RNase III)
MIHYQTGNLFDSKAHAMVNPVNCVGVMGKGLALEFKNTFPNNFKIYAAACKRGDVQPGRMLVVETQMSEPKFIVNFPTKRHWRDGSRLDDIESGLVDLALVIHELDCFHSDPGARRWPGRPGMGLGESAHRCCFGRAKRRVDYSV